MTTIQRAYKTELALNNEQITACKRHAGAARWAYNWGLARKQESYRVTGKSPSAIDLHRDLNAVKQTDVPWLYEVSKCAPQEALRNLDNAFAHFFRRCQVEEGGETAGEDRLSPAQDQKRGLGSFRLTGNIVVFSDAIQLPRLGRLRLKERGYLPTTAKILSATVSEHGGHWYVSVLVEQEQAIPTNTGPVVGVDLGIKTLATLSDGTVEPNPRHLHSALKKLKRLQRAVSRKHKGSHNRRKAAQSLGTLHRRIANQRVQHVASLHQPTGENQGSRGDRGSQRVRHAEEPPPRASHRRCRLLRIPAATDLQSGVVWLPGTRRQSLGADIKGVFRLWVGGRGPDAG